MNILIRQYSEIEKQRLFINELKFKTFCNSYKETIILCSTYNEMMRYITETKLVFFFTLKNKYT